MRTDHLLTTSPKSAEAFTQFCNALKTFQRPVFQTALAKDLQDQSLKLDAWDNLMHRAGYQSFDARQLMAATSILTGKYFSADPLIISDVAVQRDYSLKGYAPINNGQIMLYKEFGPRNTFISQYIYNQSITQFTNLYSRHKTPAPYFSAYNFVTFFNTDKKSLTDDFYLSAIVRPAVIVDHKILAAFSQCNLLSEMVEAMHNLYSLTTHDPVHAATDGKLATHIQEKYQMSAENSELADLYSRMPTNPLKEGFANEIGKRIYNASFALGFGEKYKAAITETLAVIAEFQNRSNDPDKAAMAKTLQDLVALSLGFFVPRSEVDETALKDWPELVNRQAAEGKVKLLTQPDRKTELALDPLYLCAEFHAAIWNDIAQFIPEKYALASKLVNNALTPEAAAPAVESKPGFVERFTQMFGVKNESSISEALHRINASSRHASPDYSTRQGLQMISR